METIRIFIDYWNFQLSWNERTKRIYNGEIKRLDWAVLPQVLVEEASRSAGFTDYRYRGTRVYAGLDTGNDHDRKTKDWLDQVIDRLPGYNVFLRERQTRPSKWQCKNCGLTISTCPRCSHVSSRAEEKGVDAAIVSDLFSLAWEQAYTVAILVSSDSDFVPAVQRLLEKGLTVINVTWSQRGYILAKTCWSSIELDGLVDRLTRKP